MLVILKNAEDGGAESCVSLSPVDTVYCVVLLCGLCQVTATFVGLKASKARLETRHLSYHNFFWGRLPLNNFQFYERSFIFIEIVSAFLRFYSGFPHDVSA